MSRIQNRSGKQISSTAEDLYSTCFVRSAKKIFKDTIDPGHHLFKLPPSGRQFKTKNACTNRLQQLISKAVVLKASHRQPGRKRYVPYFLCNILGSYIHIFLLFMLNIFVKLILFGHKKNGNMVSNQIHIPPGIIHASRNTVGKLAWILNRFLGDLFFESC